MRNAFYWLCLAGSILFEVAGTSVMKISQNSWPFTGLGVMYVLLFCSYFCLAKAVIKLPIGVAYAFWEGAGLALITLVSAVFLGERMDFVRATALVMVFAGTFLIQRGTVSEKGGNRGEEA